MVLFLALAGVGCGDSREEAEPAATDAKATQKGDLDGDPSDIELFSDPAADVITDADLVAYLLPGMSGPGADCVEAAIDRQAILDVEIKTGAAAAAKLAGECVTDDSFGKVIAMYAVGFSDEGATHYSDIEPCVADEFSELTASQRHDALQSIFQARLDLTGPLTSPDIAADAVARLTPCTTAAGNATDTTTAPSAGSRTIGWAQLQAGDCLPALPQGQIAQVTVVDCSVPHATEVVGASFLTSAEAENGCRNLFTNHTGQAIEATTYTLDIVEGVPGSLSARVVCLATPTSGELTTGSLK